MLLLTGAADRPRVSLMTALPLVWGEGSAADIVQGRSGRSETLKVIDRQFDLRAIDTLSAKTLGNNVTLIAQPRRLTPTELVVFDRWVRRGGRALIFADPDLVWPSRYPLGDNRRAPPVELLDPLFTHWGVALADSDETERLVPIDSLTVKFSAAAAWTGPENCVARVPEVLDCRIGQGRVILVGDADVLDSRLWASGEANNADWIVKQLQILSSDSQRAKIKR